jgi:hypothetical protein
VGFGNEGEETSEEGEEMSNIYAYTTPYDGYPAYVSVNTDDVVGHVRLTVRSPKTNDGRCGDTGEISMDPKQFRQFAQAIYSYACTNAA